MKREEEVLLKLLKDFYYDKNDIIIALLILCIAGLIIMWRIDVIMDYPQTLAKETDTIQTTEESAIGTSDAAAEDENSGQLWVGGTLTKDVTVSISGGSAWTAVDGLVSAGLFESYDEFEQVCNSVGRLPEEIKASTFTFKKGSTQTDIAEQVTN